MPSRRQEKVARVIKESIGDIIQNRLSDPRIKGFITVTEVDVSPDLRKADVFVSIMAETETAARLTFRAIEHAAKHIQSLVAHKMTGKYLPSLHFHEDQKLKKTLETLKMIEEAADEFKDSHLIPPKDEEPES